MICCFCIHLKTDFRGLPLGFHLTGGEVSDSTQLQTSLDIGPDVRPRAALTDKGCDAQANRAACRARGIVPMIPHRTNARNRPAFFPKLLYKGRARIEQAMGKLKRFKRIALRYEKTARTTAPSSPSLAPSSWSNPSTRPSRNSLQLEHFAC